MKKGIIIVGSSNSNGTTMKIASLIAARTNVPVIYLRTKIMELLSLTGGKKIGRFNVRIKFDHMSRSVFDSSFKKMAAELSYARGSVKEAAAELGIESGPANQMAPPATRTW